MPTSRASACALPRVVAGQQHGPHAAGVQPGHRVAGMRLDGVAEGEQAAQAFALRFLLHEPGDGATGRFERVGLHGQRGRGRRPAPARRRALPNVVATPIDRPFDAAAGQCASLDGRVDVEPALAGLVEHRTRERMRALALQGGSQPEHRIDVLCPTAASTSTTTGRPSVSVPVLSNATVSIDCAVSSASASLIRMPCAAATPVPAMIAVGVARPSAQGHAITSTATALTIACSQSPPATSQPTTVSAAMPSTTGTKTALTRSTMRWIGAFAACADSTMRMIRASVVSAPTAVVSIDERALRIDRAAGDAIAACLRDRQRLAGDQRFVDVAAPLADRAVDRDALARSHDDDVAHPHLLDRQLGLDAGAANARGQRSQGLQRTDRFGRLALRTPLEPLAEQHQRDHRGRGLEVQMRRAVGRRHEQSIERETVRRAGADRDQQVHVAAAGPERTPAGTVEARAEPELDRRRQRELQPAVEHRMDAEQRQHHRHHDRQRQRNARCHRPPRRRRFDRRTLRRIGQRRRFVAGLLHRGLQGRTRRHRDAPAPWPVRSRDSPKRSRRRAP